MYKAPLSSLALVWIASHLWGISAQAAITEETFYYDGVPTAEEVRAWSLLPGKRSYLFNLTEWGPPADWVLRRFEALGGATRIGIEVDAFPGEDSIDAWRSLTGRHSGKIQLIGLNAGIPASDEMDRLNRTGVRDFVFVLAGYADADSFARLNRLEGRVALTFAAGMYPRFEDRDAFLALPADIPLLFVTDYWPWYSHMDFFNLIPHDIRLRVTGSFPSDDSLEYLHHIERLRSVAVVTDFDPPNEDEWKKFNDLPVNWTCRDWIPSEQAIRAFAGDPVRTNRELTIDENRWSATREELDRLENARVSVHRIRTAPAGGD